MLADLALVIGSIFSVIFLGYVLRLTNLVSGDHAAGLGRLTTRIFLPATLFLSMATIDFNHIDWLFVLGLALGRELVYWIVFAVSSVSARHSGSKLRLAESSLRGIFATQSNDFALGLPVLSAIYPPAISQYIFLITPVQLVLMNPLAFLLIELGLVKSGLRGDGKVRFGKVLLNVLRNPIVFMTLLGLLGNAAFRSQPPDYIRRVLGIMANAFTAGALLTLGSSMVGKLKGLSGRALLGPMLLISAKTLLLPVLNTVIISLLGVGDALYRDGSVDEKGNPRKVALSLVGFIMGTFPTAPTVLLYAVDFGVLITEVTQSLVLCTLVSAPLMLVTAQLASLTIEGSSDYATLLQSTSANVTVGSMIGALLLLAFRLGSPTGKSLASINLLLLCGVVLFFCLAMQTCYADASRTGSQVRYLIIWAALIAMRVTIVISCLSLAVVHAYGAAVNRKHQIPRLIVGICVVVVITAIIGVQLTVPPMGLNGDYCWVALSTQTTSRYVAEIVLNVSCLLAILWSLLKLSGPAHHTNRPSAELTEADGTSTAASVSIAAGPYRSREDGELGADLLGHDALHQQYKANGSASHGSAGGDPVLEAWVQLADGAADEREAQRGRFSEMGDDDDEDDDEVDDEEDAAAADDNLEQARDRNDRSGQSGPGRIDQRLAMGRALAATDDELAQYDTADLVAGGLGSSRRPTEALVTPELIQGHSVSYRDQLFVVVQALANCIHTAVAIWLVTSPTASGIFVQIAFVDVFLISFQGLLAFLIFGTKYRFVRPIVKRLRRLGKRIRRIFYADSGTSSTAVVPLEDLDPTVQESIRRFQRNKRIFKTIYVRDRRKNLQRYRQVFAGAELVTFLVARNLAPDRATATDVGKHLLNSGRIVHVDDENYFRDERLFYRFTEDVGGAEGGSTDQESDQVADESRI